MDEGGQTTPVKSVASPRENFLFYYFLRKSSFQKAKSDVSPAEMDMLKELAATFNKRCFLA